MANKFPFSQCLKKMAVFSQEKGRDAPSLTLSI